MLPYLSSSLAAMKIRFIDECLDSLLVQDCPPDRVEVYSGKLDLMGTIASRELASKELI